jgi:hypothetical protein
MRVFLLSIRIEQGVFQVQHTLISDDVAHARFACNTPICRGACCVVGEAGAPIEQNEIHVLKKAYHLLENELSADARAVVADQGLVVKTHSGIELSCVGEAECVFAAKTQENVVICTIQRAYFESRFQWPKPISCHLFPIRVTTIGALDYLNFEFVPEICTPGALKGKEDKIFLSEYLKAPLVRKYGDDWYEEFSAACNHIRQIGQT